MPTGIGTSATDVRVEIDTDLSDLDIADVLDRAERDINRAYSSGTGDFADSDHRIDFEAALAALRIAEGNAPDAESRTAEEVSSGPTSVTYEASVVQTLRQRVRRRDPGSEFGMPTSVRRDTDRYVTSATPGEDV
jgi:hypothetical protein